MAVPAGEPRPRCGLFNPEGSCHAGAGVIPRAARRRTEPAFPLRGVTRHGRSHSTIPDALACEARSPGAADGDRRLRRRPGSHARGGPGGEAALGTGGDPRLRPRLERHRGEQRPLPRHRARRRGAQGRDGRARRPQVPVELPRDAASSAWTACSTRSTRSSPSAARARCRSASRRGRRSSCGSSRTRSWDIPHWYHRDVLGSSASMAIEVNALTPSRRRRRARAGDGVAPTSMRLALAGRVDGSFDARRESIL